MKHEYIIEKHKFERLSIFIAESIIRHSEKSYGFTMISRDTGRGISDDGMLGILAVPIRRVLEGKK